jgi:hypothetical protein
VWKCKKEQKNILKRRKEMGS